MNLIQVRAYAFVALSAVAVRYRAAKAAANGDPGSASDVTRGDLLTALADRRVAHTLSIGNEPSELDRDGLLRGDDH